MQIPWNDLGWACGLAAALLMAEHWAPWPRKLRRLEAYIIGVATLMMCFSILALAAHWYAPLITIWAIVAAGGVAVGLCYAIDALGDLLKQLKALWVRVKIAEREADADGEGL